MKSRFLFLISGIFLVFFLSSVSAVVVYGDWEDESQSIQITQGQSIDFNADFFTMSPPMTVNVKLYDNSGALVHAFENNLVVNGNGFAQTYTITQAIYQATGSFELVLSASDAFPDSDSHTLTLTVNPTPPPANNPPVITSTPVTQVNESQQYSYQVTATDADNDTLTYLMGGPSWLSIDFDTGLVSGTAPSVSTDTDFDITITVTDGNYYNSTDTQTYTLTVINVVSPPTNNPPTVTVISPNGGEFWSGTQNIMWNASDPDGDVLIIVIWYSPDDGETWTEIALEENDGVFSWDTTLVEDGTYLIGIDAFDDGGLSASDDSDSFFTINNFAPPQNSAPIITSTPVTSVNERASYSYQVTATDADGDTLTYSMTGPSWLSINSSTGLVSGTTPSVTADTNYNITVTVSDGTDTFTQIYTLTVRNVVGGTGGRSGGGGVRVIADDGFETQKYLDQFGPRTVIEAETPAVEKQGSVLRALLIFLGLLILALLVVLIVLFFARMGK